MNQKILSSWLIIGMVALLMGAGTFAYFNDSEHAITTISAGVIDLEVNGQNPFCGPVIQIDDLKPCRWQYENITLHMIAESNPAHVWMHIFNVEDTGGNGDDCDCDECTNPSVVHQYGAAEVTGTTDISRSDGTTVEYTYEAKPTLVKFEDADVQLGEDNTVGLTDTFIVQFCGGTTPITGHIKTGAGTATFTLNNVGDSIDLSTKGNVDEYQIRLTNIVCGSCFTFELESLEKDGNTALSHVEFVFTEDETSGGDDLSHHIEIDLTLTDKSTGNQIILINENDPQLLSDLECQWIPLTTSDGIPEFLPCNNYNLTISVHLQNVGSEYQDATTTFDVEFYAEQTDGPGPGGET